MLPMKEISLAPGVTLRTVQTQKFKTSILGVTFLEPLSEKTAALNALLPWVLQRGTQTHPDMESLSAATDDLYGGTISPVLRKKGEVQCVGFLASFLDDAFVPAGTYILEPAAQLLGEMVLSPAGDGVSFLPDYVSSEQENLIDRIRSQVNDKLQYSLSRLQEQMCQDEAYGLGKMGTEEQAKSITGQRLFARYQELLETAPIYLYYCGSADSNRVEAAFRAAFSGLPKTERRPIPQTAVRNTPEGPVRRFQDQMEVNRVELKNIEPPVEIRQAMEKQMKADREKRASILLAEGEKQAAITRAEGEKESAILRAEAVKQQRIREAEGEAEALLTVQKAQADAIRMINEANPNHNYLALRSMEAMEKVADGKATKLIVPSDMQNLAATVSAIKEISGEVTE